ncbi:MAG: FecR family protein, partial [Gammaproteobacteria bacterium]|nr:FecR family protein [Gammaproteobacteria bacterium]
MKKTNQKSKSNSAVFLLALALVCLVAVPATSSANSDGEAIFVLGTASLIKGDGSEVMLTKGDAVNEGDTVSTSKNGQVQLRMSDGGLIAVRPASEFLITAYKHNGGAQDKSFFKLVKGSFRSLTGAIGKTNKQAYRVQTPVATIGIRGTDYTARYCAGDCVDAVNGLYVGVMSGGVVVDNGVAGLDVNPGEFGFVADTVSEPVLLDSAPGNLLFASTGTSDSTNTSSASNSDAALAVMGTDSSGVNTEFTTATIYGSTSVAVSKIAISSTGTTGLYDSATGGTVVSSSAPNTDGIS